MKTPASSSYYEQFLPSDPYARAIFRVICDHVRTTLDPEITTIRFRGLAAMVEDDQRTQMLDVFKASATTWTDHRNFGTFAVDGFPWCWHFERMSRTGGKPRKNDVCCIVLVISH